MALKSDRFTVRVYGLLLDAGRVLICDELIKGTEITKFPGGGLEFGEGPKDCLVREIREEMGVEAMDLQHFHTTDHFQQSAFHETPMQVLSIYYTFRVPDVSALPIQEGPVHRKEHVAEVFRWLDLSVASGNEVSLPIDRIVLASLLAGHVRVGSHRNSTT